ncbi:hypothetical protein CCACVL1_12319 [Corchorus capsularis]|uniref:Uncharacterized protein n=1 Tax=Corchorus capsularis TaxID=210143 RepID=A0A1R3IGG3_COCAP|nr:hypothetical protein CCACVL1_12319 [Corchorus capsularis]
MGKHEMMQTKALLKVFVVGAFMEENGVRLWTVKF